MLLLPLFLDKYINKINLTWFCMIVKVLSDIRMNGHSILFTDKKLDTFSILNLNMGIKWPSVKMICLMLFVCIVKNSERV